MKRKAYKAALRNAAPQTEIDRLFSEWQESERVGREDDQTSPMAYLNGYDHPQLFTLVHTDNLHANRLEWGLIPEWVKNESDALSIRTKTLNARGETIFEKAAFKNVVFNQRCLIVVDGFFEYHHKQGKSIPHFIQHQESDKSLILGGIWSSWTNPSTLEVKETVAIVTTTANQLMAEIHNNPKLKEPRMPLILPSENTEAWLRLKDQKSIRDLIRPYPAERMKAFPVRPLIGKDGIGDSPHAVEEYAYPKIPEQGSLF